MKPNPGLIPRFNIDYNIMDLVVSIMSRNNIVNSESLGSVFPGFEPILTSSGRASLYLILKALDLKPNSRIGVPLYTCPSNFDSIINAGHVPVFIDLDPDNYTLDPKDLEKKINGLDALVVIHTFGRPANMHRIMEIAGSLPVIEDCAHALLSRYEGSPAGTMGVAGYFSFRTGKYISAGEGGLIVTSNARLADTIQGELAKLPEESFAGELKHAAKTCLRSVLYHRPWFGLISLPLGSQVEKKVDLMNKLSFKVQKIRKTDRTVIFRKLKGFDLRVEKQRANSLHLIGLLEGCGLKLPLEKENTYCNYFLFPLLAKSRESRDVLCDDLRDCGVDTTKLFSGTPEIARYSYGYSGDCPNTEFVAERILTVPSYYKLTQKEISHVADCIEHNL